MAHVGTETAHHTIRRRFRPLHWLLQWNVVYRERQKLKRSEDHRLKDMGMTRREADLAFLNRWSEHRAYPREPK